MTARDWAAAPFEPPYLDPEPVDGVIWAEPHAHPAVPLECFELTRDLLAARCAKDPDAPMLTLHHGMFLTPLAAMVGELLVGVALMRDLEFRFASLSQRATTVSSWVVADEPEGSDASDAPSRLRDELVARLAAAIADGSAAVLAGNEADFEHRLSTMVALNRDSADVDELLAGFHEPLQDRGLFVLECMTGLIAGAFPQAPEDEAELVLGLGFPYGLADVPRRLLMALPAGSPYLPRR